MLEDVNRMLAMESQIAPLNGARDVGTTFTMTT
jgi:hypothetical protein